MSDRKKIAAIVSTYTRYSHADVIVGKFIEGFPTDEGMQKARVDIASVYIDQRHPDEVGPALLERTGIPIYPSIRQALTLGGKDLEVDGVMLIVEGGDYGADELGHILYPKRAFFEQVCGVIAASGRSVPVYVDKHIAYNWADARWMIDRAAQLSIPLMAGSCLPYTWRSPALEHRIGTAISEAAAVGFGSLPAYGIHDIEVLQCMVERRRGGESGVASVQTLTGAAMWDAGRHGVWNRTLGDAAVHAIDKLPDGAVEELSKDPFAVLVDYHDGLKAVVLGLSGYVAQWSYACISDGRTLATEFHYPSEPPFPTFSYLGLNVEDFLITGVPQAPVERTLLTTGMLEAAVRSLHEGGRRIATPHLAVAYAPYSGPVRLPRGDRPTAACMAPA